MQNGKKREEIPERVFLRLKNRSLIIVQLSLQKSPVLALKASSEASIITSNAIYFYCSLRWQLYTPRIFFGNDMNLNWKTTKILKNKKYLWEVSNIFCYKKDIVNFYEE